MSKRRVVLLSNRSVLAAGVESLLQVEEGIQLTVLATDAPDLETRLRQAAPQVVVVDTGDSVLGARLLARVLEIRPQARVVALDLNQPGIPVYRRERVVATTLAGLLDAIHGTGIRRRGVSGKERGGR